MHRLAPNLIVSSAGLMINIRRGFWHVLRRPEQGQIRPGFFPYPPGLAYCLPAGQPAEIHAGLFCIWKYVICLKYHNAHLPPPPRKRIMFVKTLPHILDFDSADYILVSTKDV